MRAGIRRLAGASPFFVLNDDWLTRNASRGAARLVQVSSVLNYTKGRDLDNPATECAGRQTACVPTLVGTGTVPPELSAGLPTRTVMFYDLWSLNRLLHSTGRASRVDPEDRPVKYMGHPGRDALSRHPAKLLESSSNVQT